MAININGGKGITNASWTTSTRPLSPNDGQMGYNTDTNSVEVYNGTEWVAVATTAELSNAGFPSGTRMAFQQTSAPTGWTKDTSAAIDDAVLRLVTGTPSSGGSTAFSTFNASTATGATTLSTAQMPSHAHRAANTFGNDRFFNTFRQSVITFSTTGSALLRNVGTDAQGGGGSHTHSLATNIKYYDFIIASKD